MAGPRCNSLSHAVTDCHLQIICDDKIIYEFNLLHTRIIDSAHSSAQHPGLDGSVTLFDHKSKWSATAGQMADMGLTRAGIEALRAACI